jgi:hypothetical protein
VLVPTACKAESIAAIKESLIKIDDIDSPGADPTPFMPEPATIKQMLREPPNIQAAWKKAFVKEVQGIVVTHQAVEPVPQSEPSSIVPVKVVFKCKTNKHGGIDKLKCRIVVRGDLHDPQDPMDSWNPHATWPALRIFLAFCAHHHIFPSQADFEMAYLQAKMREKVYINFPSDWSELLPDHLKVYCGVPLLLRKALYGYTYSGKFLFEEQAEFFRSVDLRQTIIPSLWVKYYGPDDFLVILHYSDDLLAAGKPEHRHQDFVAKLKSRFSVNHQPRADFYLRARIRSNEAGDIFLDQQRYSKAIISRYLPTADVSPTVADFVRYQHPEITSNKWTKDDSSPNANAVLLLEREYNIRYIEAVGSLNYLTNTFPRGLFTIRKLCKFMKTPGRAHYKALIHFLHHIRCHPPGAIVFYHNVTTSPLCKLICDAGHPTIDPTLVWFSDSSHNDCDNQHSTGCHLGFLCGGLVDFASFVPNIVSMSSAESESNALCVASMAAAYIRQAYCDLFLNDASLPFTVPMFIDSQAAEAINANDKATKRTKHIERRALLHRHHRQCGLMFPYHINGDLYNLADIGTKSIAKESAYKVSVMEVPISEEAITVHKPTMMEEG